MRRALVLPILLTTALLLSACAGDSAGQYRVLSGNGVGFRDNNSNDYGCVFCGVGTGTGVRAGTAYLVD